MLDPKFISIMARCSSPFIGEQETSYQKAMEYMRSKSYSFDTIKSWITKDNKPYFKIFLMKANQWEEPQETRTSEQARSEYQRQEKPRPQRPKPSYRTDFYSDYSGTAHRNPFTNEEYKGKNAVNLDNSARTNGFSSTHWATEAQWKKHNKSVTGNGCVIEKWGPVRDRKTGKDRIVCYGTWRVFNQDSTV